MNNKSVNPELCDVFTVQDKHQESDMVFKGEDH